MKISFLSVKLALDQKLAKYLYMIKLETSNANGTKSMAIHTNI